MNINIEGERDQTSTSVYGRDFRARFFSPTVTQRSSYRHETEEGGMRDGPLKAANQFIPVFWMFP